MTLALTSDGKIDLIDAASTVDVAATNAADREAPKGLNMTDYLSSIDESFWLAISTSCGAEDVSSRSSQ
ncbi:hypothetical protein [Roseateles sp. BYS96W]|uniref:Uncharacterized protein n=1 Tax=Pelomonas nitida TaxID=3299027 RepID=A0ABW7G4Y0_9BURK